MRELVQANQPVDAVAVYREILAMPELESRHYIQTWHFLRQLGVQPESGEDHVYGVIVEVGMGEGFDVLAAYEDMNARYYNYSGSGVVWENPDTSLQDLIKKLLKCGQRVSTVIGPWEGPRRTALGGNEARINMLTPSGLRFGHAPMTTLAADPLGGAVISVAIELMRHLIVKASRQQTPT